MIIIGCTTAVLFPERHRIREIEEDAHAIRLVNHDVNTIHHQEITDNLLLHHLPVETKHITDEEYPNHSLPLLSNGQNEL